MRRPTRVACAVVLGTSIACAHAETMGSAPRRAPLADRIRAASWSQLETRDERVAKGEVENVRLALWSRYQEHVRSDAARLYDHEQGVVRTPAARMRFTLQKVGENTGAPWPLYIALHGGGGAARSVNDAQWAHMQSYYRDSVVRGLYVAPRGISDTWDLHFRPETYALLGRLIEDMVAFEGADPDRVYLLGFSAGGDGVWQLAPRMADHFAAVAMSAGHPNGVSIDRLYSLPFLLQVGHDDAAYDRNAAVARYCDTWQQRSTAGGYPFECFVHAGRGHNFPDNDPHRRRHAVLRDVAAWDDAGTTSTALRDTNSVGWVSRHQRTAWPALLMWDHRVAAPDVEDWLYWIAAPPGAGAHDDGTSRVRLSTSRRRIDVENPPHAFTVYLRDEMIDLDGPLDVFVPGYRCTVVAERTLSSMYQTMVRHGELPRTFTASIRLQRLPDSEGWTAAPSAVSTPTASCTASADG